jgi:uncharacterized membrane-anchored protein
MTVVQLALGLLIFGMVVIAFAFYLRRERL